MNNHNKPLSIITGASGFIGKHLARKLEKIGHKVIPLDHNILTKKSYLEYYLNGRNPDYIFHLAAYGNMATQKDEDEIVYANLVYLWNLLSTSKSINYKAFINISSSSVLLDHQTLYSATKMGGEYLCKAMVDEYKKPIITLRPYSVYGIGEAEFRFIPTVFRSCLQKEKMKLVPDSIHDWVYIDDMVNIIIGSAQLLADNKISIGKVIGVGTGFGYSNLEVVKQIEQITGKKANISKVTSLRSFDTTDWISPIQVPSLYALQEGLEKIYEHLKHDQ